MAPAGDDARLHPVVLVLVENRVARGRRRRHAQAGAEARFAREKLELAALLRFAQLAGEEDSLRGEGVSCDAATGRVAGLTSSTNGSRSPQER